MKHLTPYQCETTAFEKANYRFASIFQAKNSNSSLRAGSGNHGFLYYCLSVIYGLISSSASAKYSLKRG